MLYGWKGGLWNVTPLKLDLEVAAVSLDSEVFVSAFGKWSMGAMGAGRSVLVTGIGWLTGSSPSRILFALWLSFSQA
jgi:hypothetical protein